MDRIAAIAALGLAAACTSGERAGEAADQGRGQAAGVAGGVWAIDFYQRWLGDQWIGHCPFQPSCSNFGKESIAEYGLLPGSLMAADRLMRDHNLAYARYAADERGRPLDPPADNALFGPRVDESEARPTPRVAADFEELRNPPLDGDDEQLAFADQLFGEHEWERARVEYERLLFHHASSPHANRCHRQMALCFARLGRAGDALAEVGRLPAGRETDDVRALVLRDLGRPGSALAAVDTSDPEGRLLAGFLALEAVDVDAARRHFQELEAPLREPLLARVTEFEELPTKSRWLAGSMSAVLPGSGQLYAGRPEDGLVAFLTNGVLIGATALAWHRDERVTAGALGVVALGFYLGNVYGGVNAVAKHDRALQEGALARTRGWLRSTHLWMSVAPDGKGGALGIYLGF
jgi:putative component of membrane protein insertase Oxa1/YidC/SpoIIIJ protein YidD